jgi:hypothetical protein
MGKQFARAVRAACAVERNVTGDARPGGTMVLLDNIVEIPAAEHFDELPLRILLPLKTERTVTRDQPTISETPIRDLGIYNAKVRRERQAGIHPLVVRASLHSPASQLDVCIP